MNTKHALTVAFAGLLVASSLSMAQPAPEGGQVPPPSPDEVLPLPAPQELPPFEDPGSQGASASIEEFDLEGLLNGETTVASRVPTTVRETPGVVTIITGEEIRASGARDLIDVLRWVPGFDFGHDVEAVVGAAFRGNWGHEGKVLLLWDGQQMNETLFATTQFGNHYPVEHIERIEIIRGPGSTIYGGYAELAVINVVTRRGRDLMGVSLVGTYGFTSEGFARRNLSLSGGYRLTNGVDISIAGLLGEGRQGDDIYTDFYDSSFQLTDHRQDPSFLNIGVSYKDDLTLRYVRDNYRVTTRDGFDAALSEALPESFTTNLLGASYRLKLHKSLAVTPQFNFMRYEPWRITRLFTTGGEDLEDLGLRYMNAVNRYQGQVTAEWHPKWVKGMTLVAGGMFYYERAVSNEEEEFGTDTDGDGVFDQFDDHIDYVNGAGFFELNWKNPIVNVVSGVRFEKHELFDGQVVPRVALTRIFGDFHAKLLFNMAFRAPSVENISLNAQVKPERTTVGEAEVGYKFDDHNFLTSNAFLIFIDKPIIYFYDDESGAEGYENYDEVRTAGVDLEYRLRYRWGRIRAAYSYYRPVGGAGNIPELYQVPVPDCDPASGVCARGDALNGFGNHKLSVNGAFKYKDLSISPTVVLMSPKRGMFGYDYRSDDFVIGKSDPIALLDIFAQYRIPGTDGLKLGVGVFNLLDSKDVYLQPYAASGFHAPVLGRSREFLARLSYDQVF